MGILRIDKWPDLDRPGSKGRAAADFWPAKGGYLPGQQQDSFSLLPCYFFEEPTSDAITTRGDRVKYKQSRADQANVQLPPRA